jgi:hypothetical protein
MPGAAVWGDAIPSPFAIAAGVVRNGRALLIAEDSRLIVMRSLDSADPVRSDLWPAMTPGKLSISSNGARALIASAEAGLAQFVTDIGNAPELTIPFDWDAHVAAAAVADSVNCVLLGKTGALSRLCEGEGERTLYSSEDFHPAAIAWLDDDTRAAVADRHSDRILLFDASIPGPPLQELAGAGHGIAEPVTIAAAGSGELLVTNNRTWELTRIRPGVITQIALPAMPAALELLPSGLIFGPPTAREPALLIDLAEERAYAVPVR